MRVAAESGVVPWRQVALFTVIAYALTWGWDGIWVAPHLGSLLTAPTTPADPTAVFGNRLNHLPAMFGPLVAAVAMRLWVSREGLRWSLGLRQSWQAYAVALAAPIAFLAVVALAMVATGLARFAPPGEPFTIAVVGLLAVLLGLESVLGLGEEYGWRGYLLPRLMPLGEVPATLVLGIIWGLWHLPVLVSGVILGGHSLWLVVPIHLGVVMLSAFPYTWLAKATGYSPVLAASFHGSTNWGQQRLFGVLVLGNLLAGIVVIGFGWLMVIVVVYGIRRFGPRRRAGAAR
ncbi:MAG: CPBP family intramembrane glutamic endopeptidase [Bauldia sp.]